MARISVAEWVGESRTADLDLERFGTLTVTYKPGEMDAFTSRKFMRLLGDNDPLAASRILAGVITDWEIDGPLTGEREVVDAEGEPVRDAEERLQWEKFEVVKAGDRVPIDPEVMQFLPNAFLLRLWSAIQTDAMVDPKGRSANA